MWEPSSRALVTYSALCYSVGTEISLLTRVALDVCSTGHTARRQVLLPVESGFPPANRERLLARCTNRGGYGGTGAFREGLGLGFGLNKVKNRVVSLVFNIAVEAFW